MSAKHSKHCICLECTAKEAAENAQKPSSLAATHGSDVEIVANALYKHRYPRAGGRVSDRTHPTHRRFWEEADAVLSALRQDS